MFAFYSIPRKIEHTIAPKADTHMNWPNASFGIICSYIMKAAFSNEWAAQYRSRVALQNKTMVLLYVTIVRHISRCW